MTAIVGLAHEGRVHLGGDSAGVSGWALTVRSDAKVFRNGPYVIGFTSSFRMGQLLRHAFYPPAPTSHLDRFMTTAFVDSVRACLKEGGWAKKDSDQEKSGVFLVGVAGRLFTLDDDYQVGEPADGFDSVGCGGQVARGALYASAALPPRQRLTMALEAAERFSAGVRGPFTFASTRRAR